MDMHTRGNLSRNRLYLVSTSQAVFLSQSTDRQTRIGGLNLLP